MKRIRVVGIVIRGDELLLIHRRNKEEYYVFPGGKVEEGERVEDAVLRELDEETSIKATIGKFLYKISYYDDNSEHQFYLCHYQSGIPKLSDDCEEKKEMEKGEEFYRPLWVKLRELKNLKVYPPEVPGWILRDFASSFN